MAKIKKPKVKHISLKSLRKKAWKLQSEYIRRKEGGICFTCTDTRPWKEQQAGHYIHGDRMDFVFLNIHCQCVRCNKWLSGNSGIYAEKMIVRYGLDTVTHLREIDRERKSKAYKYSIFELEEIILRYELKLEEIK